MSSPKIKCAYMNEEQKKVLIDFMTHHPELKSGKFSSNFTIRKAQKLWEELANELHKIPGAVKEWKQWRKTWQDMRNSIKSKSASIKNHRRQTGGGPPSIQILTENDQNVLALIGSTAVEGHAQIEESHAKLVWEDSPVQDIEYLESDEETIRAFSYSENTANFSFESKENIQNNNIKQPQKQSIFKEIMQGNTMPKTNAASKKPYVKRTSAALRYDTSIKQAERLSEISSEDLEIRKAYYKDKLILLKQNLVLKERKVIATEKLVTILEEIAKKFSS